MKIEKTTSRVKPYFDATEAREFSCREGYPHAQKRAHCHSEIEINLLTQGRITYLWHDRLVTVGRDILTLFWAGMPHQVIQAEKGSQCYWIYVPLTWFLQWRLPAPFTKAVLGGQMVRHALDAKDAMGRAIFQQWHMDMARNLSELNAIVLLEIEARVRRLAMQFVPEAGSYRRRTRRVPAGPISSLETMVRLMAREYRNPIKLVDIAGETGLHPNYACALFSRVCGISMRTYLTRLRVSHAQRLLATTDMKIVDIAMDAGFASLSRFYAAFEAAARCSPRAYREQFLAHINKQEVLSRQSD